jgi:hypothetical protein
MIKNIVLFILGVSLVVLAIYLIIPATVHREASWSTPIDGGHRYYQFSTYSIPNTYRQKDYRDSSFGRQKLVIYRNDDTQQQFLIFILRELPKVDFARLSTESKMRITSNRQEQDLGKNPHLSLVYYLPMSLIKEIPLDIPDAIIKGFEVAEASDYETEKTDIKVFRGEFNNIGFQRRSEQRFKEYSTPGFKANTRMEGALALINNKENGYTIFAIGCNAKNEGSYNHDDFIGTIKTITFDPKPGGLNLDEYSHKSY